MHTKEVVIIEFCRQKGCGWDRRGKVTFHTNQTVALTLTQDGWNLLHIAARDGNVDVVNYLVANAFPVHFPCKYNGMQQNALGLAVQRKNEIVVNTLLANETEVSTRKCGNVWFLSTCDRLSANVN